MENVLPGTESNFIMKTEMESTHLGVPFDYVSVMQYTSKVIIILNIYIYIYDFETFNCFMIITIGIQFIKNMHAFAT